MFLWTEKEGEEVDGEKEEEDDVRENVNHSFAVHFDDDYHSCWP